MGSGHDAVAAALAARLADAGHDSVRADILTLLPAGIGRGLRAGYRTVIERAPVLYAGIYRAFFRGGFQCPGNVPRPGSTPLAALAEDRLLDLLARHPADVVVPVFHLAAQVTGRLRARGALPVPSAVVMTEFEAHRQWLHPGNDLYLCHAEEIAAGIRRGTGCPAAGLGPIVDTRFTDPEPTEGGLTGTALTGTALTGPGLTGPGLTGSEPGLGDRPLALMSTGAWGIGSSLARTAALLHRDGYAPVILCGRNERLRRALAATLETAAPGATALGWVRDMPALMRAASVLVDNAAGQTAMEALAVGLPVIGYRPIPGHGADGVRLMARLRLSDYARDPGELRDSLRMLTRPGRARERRIAAGRAVFRPGAISALASLPRDP
ncbi:MAG: glycosyltransferase [Nocardiopsaceae bacterium]|nr:glycosyltransferase [Nocardiopsaceae bacterium]